MSKQRIGLFFHTDLDGFYSALAVANQFDLEPDLLLSVEYGRNYQEQIAQLDQAIILDFAENFGGDKTSLWADHHIRKDQPQAETTINGEAQSCLRLLSNKNVVSNVDESIIKHIDTVDSASYDFDTDYTPEDFLFPTFQHEVDKYVVLNQLLRKNRKRGIAEKIFDKDVFDIDVYLYKIEKERNPKVVKYNDYIDAKRNLLEKVSSDKDRYIQLYDRVPLILTREFSREDWIGWDLNLFAYLLNESPFIVIAYEFNNSLNFQVARNLFNSGNLELAEILEGVEEELNGHEGILNFRYDNKSEAIEKLDVIVSKIAKHL